MELPREIGNNEVPGAGLWNQLIRWGRSITPRQSAGVRVQRLPGGTTYTVDRQYKSDSHPWQIKDSGELSVSVRYGSLWDIEVDSASVSCTASATTVIWIEADISGGSSGADLRASTLAGPTIESAAISGTPWSGYPTMFNAADTAYSHNTDTIRIILGAVTCGGSDVTAIYQYMYEDLLPKGGMNTALLYGHITDARNDAADDQKWYYDVDLTPSLHQGLQISPIFLGSDWSLPISVKGITSIRSYPMPASSSSSVVWPFDDPDNSTGPLVAVLFTPRPVILGYEYRKESTTDVLLNPSGNANIIHLE